MIESLVVGLIAAVSSFIPKYLREISFISQFSWNAPIWILGIAGIAMIAQYFYLDRKQGTRDYDGLADLFIHIHSPPSSDSAIRWILRGFLSFLLTLFGGHAGPEGASVEFAHAFAIKVRARSSRWFEARRRTDAACVLAAGVTAAFGTPFAGVLLPMELEMGGRTVSIAVSALVSFLMTRFLWNISSAHSFDLSASLVGLRFLEWKEWLGILVIGLACGILGAVSIRFIRYSQDSLIDLFQRRGWMRVLAGGILLFLIAVIYRQGNMASWNVFEQALWSQRGVSQLGLLFFTELLGISIVLAGFGTVGIFWPLFTLGALGSLTLAQFVIAEYPGFSSIPGYPAVAALSGAAGLWGAVFGAPLAGAVLAFELTQNLHVLLAALVAGFVAREIRKHVRTQSLVEVDLNSRGITLIEGRSFSVLDAILVKDAMIADHEIVHEHEPVSNIYSRLLKSRYPFLPVVNAQGIYIGLLTTDMVQEAWQTQESVTTSHSSLAKLLEAKDLLYRAGFRTSTVRPNDRLSVTAGLFQDIPCVPVLGDDGRVLGLLFVHNVRLAYDREVAKRTLVLSEREV